MSTESRWNEPILGLTNVKRQHYVPQMYLRQFAGNDGKLLVVDLDNQDRLFRTSLLNAAVEARLYNLEIEGRVYSAESWLSELEGLSTPVIQQLIDDPSTITSLGLENELILARFIAALFFRTPSFGKDTSSMVDSMLQRIKDNIKGQIFHQYSPEEAVTAWEEMSKQPDHWWWGQTEPTQPAEMAIDMLGEVQGWANFLRGAPWRIGRVPKTLQLYTSDNPVARYLKPVRPWWDFPAFSTYIYYVPLSPDTLLKIERRRDIEGEKEIKPAGERRQKDFSLWEASVARHVITSNANRFLYGEGSKMTKAWADAWLQSMEQVNVDFAVRYQGFNPDPPNSLLPKYPAEK